MTMSYLGVLNPMDIDLDQVNCFAGVSDADYEGEVVIIKGNIDLDTVKQALERDDAYVDEYRQIETWEIDSGGWSYYDTSLLTFIDDMLIVGTDDAIRAVIDVFQGHNTALYDNANMSDVMDRLPGGVIISCDVEEEYEDLVFLGTSMYKIDQNTLGLTGVFKFESEQAAENATDQVANDLAYGEESLWVNIEVMKNDGYVTATAEADIDYFNSLLSGGESDANDIELKNVRLAVTALLADAGTATLSAGEITAGNGSTDVSGVTALSHTLDEYLEGANDMKCAYEIFNGEYSVTVNQSDCN
ncbi:hypothetical protein ACFLU3_00700 [Chloroflexota bacterium]